MHVHMPVGTEYRLLYLLGMTLARQFVRHLGSWIEGVRQSRGAIAKWSIELHVHGEY